MKAVPRRLLVLGGGPVGVEMAQAVRRLGGKVALEGRELRGDRLLVATGRRPRVDGLGLETVGVEADGHGVPVNAQLRAGKRLWAIGDITGIWPLTQAGARDGRGGIARRFVLNKWSQRRRCPSELG